MWVHSLGREDPQKNDMATHSFSCLENPMDRGAWWASIHRVTNSSTQLKWLSMCICICICLSIYLYIYALCLVVQLCPTLCNPTPLPIGILQARTLEWVAIRHSLLQGSSQPRDWTQSATFRWILYHLSHQGSPIYTHIYNVYLRRQWHPTPVLLLGKSHGRRSLVGWNPWGR